MLTCFEFFCSRSKCAWVCGLTVSWLPMFVAGLFSNAGVETPNPSLVDFNPQVLPQDALKLKPRLEPPGPSPCLRLQFHVSAHYALLYSALGVGAQPRKFFDRVREGFVFAGYGQGGPAECGALRRERERGGKRVNHGQGLSDSRAPLLTSKVRKPLFHEGCKVRVGDGRGKLRPAWGT